MNFKDRETLAAGTKHHAKSAERKEAYKLAYHRILDLELLAEDAFKALQEVQLSRIKNGDFVYTFESRYRRLVES